MLEGWSPAGGPPLGAKKLGRKALFQPIGEPRKEPSRSGNRPRGCLPRGSPGDPLDSVMRTLSLALLAMLAQGNDSLASPDDDTAKAPREAAAARGFIVPRPGPVLVLPRDETLIYDAQIELGPFSASVGTVTQRSEVEPYQRSLLLQQGSESGEVGLETATVSLRAQGDYTFYEMDSLIETRVLPREWPQVTYRMISKGTEKRRREIKLGEREGSFQASYRRDTSQGAPKGTRIWRDPSFREIPEDTVDMLSSIFLARTLIEDEIDTLSFPMIDKLQIWDVKLTRGQEKRMKLPAGTFDCVEIIIQPTPRPGENVDDKKKKKFRGLFGMRGNIHLWVDRKSGVPVRIQGDIPAGIVTLGVDVKLKSHAGTPSSFKAVGRP